MEESTGLKFVSLDQEAICIFLYSLTIYHPKTYSDQTYSWGYLKVFHLPINSSSRFLHQNACHNGKPLSLQKEGNFDVCDNVEEPREYHSKGNKAGT